jgi:hypothetical protein
MTDPGDIWQRYDAKVVQIRELEARLTALEKELQTSRHERDHWARVGRQLSKKLQVARALAERLREAQPVAAPTTQRPAELEVRAGGDVAGLRAEFDRAREVLGLVLTALTKALDDDDEAVAELGRRLRHHAGGKLLYSITRGSLTLVPVDGRYLVDRTWLGKLDLASLRGELDVAAQSGVYAVPEDASIVHTQPGRQYRPPSVELPRFAPPAAPARSELDDLQVDLEGDEDDYSEDLPPPPPLPAAGFVGAPPPLIGALPSAEDEIIHASTLTRLSPPVVAAAKPEPPKSPAPRPEPPKSEPPQAAAVRPEDTVRTTTRPLHELIPNLRIGRLVKTPSGG